jgi:hypothetical protein
MGITRLDREDFLENYWSGLYSPGEHTLVLGPTGRAGKTYLSMQLMEAATSSVDKVLLCMKPKDATVSKWSANMGYKIVDDWPPKRHWWEDEPSGYTVWPRHNLQDFDATKKHLRDVFLRTLTGCYSNGNCLVNMDEIYGLAVELGLSEHIISILTRGRSMGCGALVCSQRPSGTMQGSLPGPVLNQPSHYFLSNESDKRQRDRLTEIAGGHDPDFINATTLSLPKYNFLYLNADGESAIIGP